MRLWSLHPEYLDTKGLVAAWREALLAQKVLKGETTGYKNHPQLIRFKKSNDPMGAIGSFLNGIFMESLNRGFHFDANKINSKRFKGKIKVTSGQLEYEFDHLIKKLRYRDPEVFLRMQSIKEIKSHPLFYVARGPVEPWEKI